VADSRRTHAVSSATPGQVPASLSLAEIKALTSVRQARATVRLVVASAVVLTMTPVLALPSSAVAPSAVLRGATTVVGATTSTTRTGVAPLKGFGEAGTRQTSVVASSSSTLTVHDAPDLTSPSRLLDPVDEVSGQLVFLVKDQRSDWLQVYLPVRPNGSTGWLRRDQVELFEHGYRIELSLSAHRLALFDGAQVLMEEPIGVGAEDTPTPGGVYYIKELLRPPDPSGFYGPYAYGLSGFSNVLDDYAGGTGVIGLHGNDDASSIGRDVSHGCIRLHNEAITRMVEEIGLPLGTPVIIVS
jgi:hypothetical protein